MFINDFGLSSKEAEIRQKQYGLNVLPEKKPPSNFSLLLSQLKNPLIYILLIASFVTIIIGDFADTIIILIAVFINTILGFIQERKATNALYSLKEYIINKAIVIRDGKRISIETKYIVPGDVVILSAGSKIPADGKLITSNRFFVDESLLTGESMPVGKNEKDLVFMGTTVVSGQAVMKVESIGQKTEIGSIALKIQKPQEDTPFQKQMKIFGKQLVVLVGILIAIVFLVGIIYRFSINEIFLTSVALAVSSIPEGLIVSLTVVLAIGMHRILKRKGLVRSLSAAETLGGVTVICIDKTGTLTQGIMKVVDYFGDKKRLAEQVVVANDLDDPIVVSAFNWGKNNLNSIPKYPRIDSIPFSPKDRFFAALCRHSKKSNKLYVNGAPELLVKWSAMSEKGKRKILLQIDNLAKQGKRLVGFAQKDLPISKKSVELSDVKEGLEWVGLLVFSDPVRLGVKEALQKAKNAGIRVIVITGDYPKTAIYVLSELGIDVEDNRVMTGEYLNKITPEQLSKEVSKVDLFARTTPDQKFMIVNALKKNGEVVAMMGDGVNDAPALQASDIGIAVGEATDVAKESADLVILDSNFSTILAAIEEGRAIFENIRKIILYLMSDAFAEIIIVIFGIILGLPLPLNAAQILWINLVSDGFPNMSLAFDPKRYGIMSEKPRSPSEKIVSRWMVVLIGCVSFVAGIIALLSFFVVYKTTGDVVMARSMAFITLGLNSLVYVFSVRAFMVPFWKSRFFENKWLILSVIAGLLLQIFPFTTQITRDFFGIGKVSLSYWFIAIFLSIFMFFTVEFFKFVYRLSLVKINS
jgi:Ca2+-transporting ATPase